MKKRKITTIILLSILFVGISMLLYPALANYWNSKTQGSAVTSYEERVHKLTGADYTRLLLEAMDYNRRLSALNFPLTEYEQIEGYSDALNVGGDGMMGYLIIDKIHVQLPVYHGTGSAVLRYACGHVEGTSLPVGGTGTHAVLSAHRGLASAKLFTDLDRMEIGDYFRIIVFDREFIYRVDQIKTVLPTDANDIFIDPSQDYVTLLTCTPYGINTHRLLVRGVRTETIAHSTTVIKSDAYLVDKIIVTSLVALPMLLGLIVYVCVKPASNHKAIKEKIIHAARL